MKIASIVLIVLLIAVSVALALTTNALKSTKAQLAHVQAQLADEVAHSSALQHALQTERIANDEYLEKTKKADETRDAFLRIAHCVCRVPRAHHKRAKVYERTTCTRSIATRRRSRPCFRTATRIANRESSQQ